MKTKFLWLLGVMAAFCFLAGCVVLSVYPFYTPKDLIYDPGLDGRWAKADATNGFWSFASTGTRSYDAAFAEDHKTNLFDAHLFQLKSFKFLDLRTTNREDFQLPLHLIMKFDRKEDQLSLTFMDYGWLAKYLETNPGAVRHIVVLEKPDDTNSSKMVYLTAETKDLQKFLLQHAADTNAFNSGDELQLLTP